MTETCSYATFYDKGRHTRNVGEYFFDCMKRVDYFCNLTSIFALQAISSTTTNKDPQDIKVESANLLPCPFKQAVGRHLLPAVDNFFQKIISPSLLVYHYPKVIVIVAVTSKIHRIRLKSTKIDQK